MNENVEVRSCARCGNTFVVGPHPNKRFCSPLCSRKWHKKNFNLKASALNADAHTLIEVECAGCGKPFVRKKFKWNKKYCSRKCYRENSILKSKFGYMRCKNCGRIIERTTRNRKFCSDFCRVRFNRGGESNEVIKPLQKPL